MVNEKIARYQTQQVMTASPAKLISMLYDKAILSLKEAVAAIEKGDIEARWRANKKAMDIIGHMWSTLDLEKGGEIARNLDGLFSFMLARLPRVDIENDPEVANQVIELLEPLRRSWHDIVKGGGAQDPDTPDGGPGREPGRNEAILSGSISA